MGKVKSGKGLSNPGAVGRVFAFADRSRNGKRFGILNPPCNLPALRLVSCGGFGPWAQEVASSNLAIPTPNSAEAKLVAELRTPTLFVGVCS